MMESELQADSTALCCSLTDGRDCVASLPHQLVQYGCAQTDERPTAG